MIIKLEKDAYEKSVYFVDVTFRDEDKVPFTPVTASWSLLDSKGTVVNGRTGVSITPADTVTIVLSGEDLAVGGNLFLNSRMLLVEGTYNSNNGSGLPFKVQVYFNIKDLVGVS